ncbi:MAG: hypothetical protein ACNI3C_05145 [Candidatus Marinarcus sp.]|uniref:hypothetical protein n=1 Tax=Candidatus Marinarcus sp. TaxID=3100987 RepID=UPI003B008BED
MEDFNAIVDNVLTVCLQNIEEKSIGQETIVGLYYIKDYLKNGHTLSEQNKMLTDKILFSLKHKKELHFYISHDIRFLILLYLVGSIQNIKFEQKRLKEFFSIYLIFEEFENIIDNKELIHLLFPQDKLSSYLKYLYYAIIADKGFWKRTLLEKEKIIYKLFFITLFIYERSKEAYHEMFGYLYELFEKALKQKDEEFLFYLYFPLHFSHNGVATIPAEFKYFNDKVEVKYEKYIQENLIDKYKLQPVQRDISSKKVIKIAFLQERLINYSIYKVFYSLVKSLSEQKSLNYEIVILDLNFPQLSGSNYFMQEEIKALGFEFIDCHTKLVGQSSPFYTPLKKCLDLRNLIIENEIDILIGMHTQIEYNFLFTTRTAPTQIYWSHGNSEYNIKNIDKKISHFVQKSRAEEFKTFNVTGDYTRDDDIAYEEEAKAIRETFPKDVVILGSIGRLIKIDNLEYLNTVLEIMKQNLNTIYIACGDGDTKHIKRFLKEHDLENRFVFPGFVNTKVYGRVIDIYLNTFPDPGGESVNEFRTLGSNKFVVNLVNN